eukprot:129302_1
MSPFQTLLWITILITGLFTLLSQPTTLPSLSLTSLPTLSSLSTSVTSPTSAPAPAPRRRAPTRNRRVRLPPYSRSYLNGKRVADLVTLCNHHNLDISNLRNPSRKREYIDLLLTVPGHVAPEEDPSRAALDHPDHVQFQPQPVSMNVIAEEEEANIAEPNIEDEDILAGVDDLIEEPQANVNANGMDIDGDDEGDDDIVVGGINFDAEQAQREERGRRGIVDWLNVNGLSFWRDFIFGENFWDLRDLVTLDMAGLVTIGIHSFSARVRFLRAFSEYQEASVSAAAAAAVAVPDPPAPIGMVVAIIPGIQHEYRG